MAQEAVHKAEKQVFRKLKKARHEEVGAFLFVIGVGAAILVGLYVLGLVQELFLLLGILVVLFFVYSQSPPIIVELAEYERAVVLRYGKFLKIAGPGWVFVIPFIDDPRIVDLRVTTVDIKPQEVLTKNNIKLVIDAILYIRIKDPKAAIINVRDPIEASASYVQAHLRDLVGKMELEAVISQVNIINELLHKGLERVSRDWGVEIVKVEIQSVELPSEVLSAMHERKAAEQRKFAAEEAAKAQAIKIEAIRKAAGELSDPALKYLYLQALEKVAEGKSSKIIFPLELTHLAASLAGRAAPPQRFEHMEERLQDKYREFVLEETREGVPVSTEEILKTLKRKAESKGKK
jgi:regulator of protease activity HflC (stomatin/prohibitin superfamily)